MKVWLSEQRCRVLDDPVDRDPRPSAREIFCRTSGCIEEAVSRGLCPKHLEESEQAKA